jgi:hypothetical protein
MSKLNTNPDVSCAPRPRVALHNAFRQVLLYYYDSQVRAQQATGSVASAALWHWAAQAQQTVATALTPQI